MFFYPTALLADLTTTYLAHCIENSRYDRGRAVFSAPRAKETRANEWGQALSAMYRNETEYTPPELPSVYGETVRKRIYVRIRTHVDLQVLLFSMIYGTASFTMYPDTGMA